MTTDTERKNEMPEIADDTACLASADTQLRRPPPGADSQSMPLPKGR